MAEYFHSVTLSPETCKGCTNCIKSCPTQAIRVRRGRARIIKERCIDCGECIRICPYHAKKAITGKLSEIQDYAYKIAIPAPALYGQFQKNYSIDTILNGLIELGFDDVYEVALAADMVSHATRELFKKGQLHKPVISSACPAVLRLISVRFPTLLANVIPLKAPIDIAAQHVRAQAIEKTGLPSDQIGIFFITPCPAKATTIKAPLGVSASAVDGVIAIKDIYKKLLSVLPNIKEIKPLAKASYDGVLWARVSGESKGVGSNNYVAADGIANCIQVLDEIDNGRLSTVDFVELSSCIGGCVGGPLTVENAYVAKNRVKKAAADAVANDPVEDDVDYSDLLWDAPVVKRDIMNLSDNMETAMKRMSEIDALYATLPQIDCGACGSPSCHDMAEDIVNGFAHESDCIFKLREKVRELDQGMIEL